MALNTTDVAPPPGRLLDSPPPESPAMMKRARASSLVENQMAAQRAQGAGLGAAGGDPQMVASEAIGDIERGFTRLGAVLPALAPALGQVAVGLRQAVIQGLADMLAGTDSLGAA